jgi:hypothetical protein
VKTYSGEKVNGNLLFQSNSMNPLLKKVRDMIHDRLVPIGRIQDNLITGPNIHIIFTMSKYDPEVYVWDHKHTLYLGDVIADFCDTVVEDAIREKKIRDVSGK